MAKSIKFISSLFLFLFSISMSLAQEEERKEIYRHFDAIIGQENTGLLNGTEYIERNRTLNEHHKYFLSQEFLKGFVKYDGQPYYGIDMKYNIWNDLLLVRIKYAQAEPVLELHKNKIGSFEIDNHRFLSVLPEESGNGVKGFYEILLENDILKLLKKYKKKEKTILDREYSYYEYRPDEAEYVLFFEGKYEQIDSRGELSNFFPEIKTEIRKIYRKKRKLRKSDSDQFMTNLVSELTPLLKASNK
ncbi:MAG TPA: hypothetical protein VFM59_02055 [Salinimicrobium sp.]|nr:hypothetical protein [Salinimicrobium sp.]